MPDDHIGIKNSKINFLWLMMSAPKFQLKTKNNSIIYMGKKKMFCITGSHDERFWMLALIQTRFAEKENGLTPCGASSSRPNHSWRNSGS